MPLRRADDDVARPAARPLLGVAGRDQRTRPLAVLAQAVNEHAHVAGRDHVVTPVTVPVGDEQAVDDALALLADGLALPVRRTVGVQRRDGVVGVREPVGRLGGDDRRAHEQRLVADGQEPHAMRRHRQLVDLRERPRLARILAGLEDADLAGVLPVGAELVGERQLRNPVAVHVGRREVHHARRLARDHVRRPVRVLVPDQLGVLRAQADQIDLAVLVHVGGHHLVAAAKAGRHDVRVERSRRPERRRGRRLRRPGRWLLREHREADASAAAAVTT